MLFNINLYYMYVTEKYIRFLLNCTQSKLLYVAYTNMYFDKKKLFFKIRAHQ